MLLFVACEVPFSPNAEWKETPVVYCLLDQDEDTTWVRVEKCFLGEGNIHNYGGISDSINYPAGSIAVNLLAYKNGVQTSSVQLRDTVLNHNVGAFSNLNQPIYFTPIRLDEQCMYKLELHQVADGRLLASTDSIPLIIRDPSNSLFVRPTVYDRFIFRNRSGGDPACQIEWNQFENARLYQPIVRFYYSIQGDTQYVDLKCQTVASGTTQGRLSTYYSRQAFLQGVYEALKDDPNPKKYLKTVDLYLTACDENLNVYMSNINSGNSIDQSYEPYTNIHGGLGIFGARRTKLYHNFDADSSLLPPDGLHYLLKNLDVGIE